MAVEISTVNVEPSKILCIIGISCKRYLSRVIIANRHNYIIKSDEAVLQGISGKLQPQ